MIAFGSDCRYRCDPRGDFLIMPSSSNCIRPSRFSGFAPVLVGCVLLAGTFSQARTASELFKDRQYGDVIKVLTDEIKNKPDAEVALQHLLLAESYYLTDQFALARPFYEKAAQNLPEGPNRIIAEFRLAGVAFRMKDFKGAEARIDAFVTRHPADARVGTLLLYKMKIAGAAGGDAGAQLEQIHGQIQANTGKYDALTVAQADQILCDYFRKSGQPDKAESIYKRMVMSYRNAITRKQRDKEPVPASLEKAHDSSALQLGALYIEKKQPGEAAKWLENVQFDLESRQKAKVLLAKLAFERGDFDGVGKVLIPSFVETVPPGALRDDMFLLLGMAEKKKPGADVGKAEEFLKRIPPEAKGFGQAQAALGDMYFEKGLGERAIAPYTKSLASADHAPRALRNLGEIYLGQSKAAEGAKAKELRDKAVDAFRELLTKYPISSDARQARDTAAALGVTGGGDMTGAWKKSADERKGTPEGAQALISLIRFYAKRIADEKTGQLAQAPDYVAGAKACDRLLDEKVYAGSGFAEKDWKALRSETLFNRGLCELASFNPAAAKKGAQPVFLKMPAIDRAIEFFQQAKADADPKALDLVKSIELGLVEAMFKSAKKENKEQAERRFAELESDYGNDPRFQNLAIELAEWYRSQNRYAEAAQQYVGVANRAKDIPAAELLNILDTAGSYYSRAAADAQKDASAATIAIHIHPKETISLGTNLLTAYAPLQKTIRLEPPAKPTTAAQALEIVSKAAGIPFVWSQGTEVDSLASRLAKKAVRLPSGETTVAAVLKEILDPAKEGLAFDIGISGGKPTIDPPAAGDDPAASEAVRVIEIFDVRLGAARYAPLARKYGAWDAESKRQAMLFRVLRQVEEVSQLRVLWAEGVDKEAKLAAEFAQPPGVSSASSVADILAAVLAPQGLTFKLIRRDVATDWYEAAKDAFNRVRQIDPKSRFGERALFSVALNFYNQKDYGKMKIVLKEYLKTFDSTNSENFHQACFWTGWALENEKNLREAATYYARAAEERIVIFKSDKMPPREELKAQLAYDSQFALMEPVGGAMKEMTLGQFTDFLRVNSHVSIQLDPGAQTVAASITREIAKGTPGFTLLCDVLEPLGLTFRAENVKPDVAEKAYYRIASTYRKDNLMPQALENCRFLLARYPQTARRHETQGLMLDIYKGLKDYRNVLATIEELRKSATDDQERRRLDAEVAWIWFDMADYAKAADAFKKVLSSAKERPEQLSAREGYAKALLRAGQFEEALSQFESLEKEDSGLKQIIDQLIIFSLKFDMDKALEREFPQDALRLIQKYESLTPATRQNVTGADLAKVTWIYYVLARIDLRKQRTADAIEKLIAASKSPDDYLAGDASYQLGMIHLKAGQFEKAREAFEYLLFATRSPESAVRGTYSLGICLQKLGRTANAKERFDEVVNRYPLSPYVGIIQKMEEKK
jgi:tetratricopeptide (TPR) repeat protein